MYDLSCSCLELSSGKPFFAYTLCIRAFEFQGWQGGDGGKGWQGGWNRQRFGLFAMSCPFQDLKYVL